MFVLQALETRRGDVVFEFRSGRLADRFPERPLRSHDINLSIHQWPATAPPGMPSKNSGETLISCAGTDRAMSLPRRGSPGDSQTEIRGAAQHQEGRESGKAEEDDCAPAETHADSARQTRFESGARTTQ